MANSSFIGKAGTALFSYNLNAANDPARMPSRGYVMVVTEHALCQPSQ